MSRMQSPIAYLLFLLISLLCPCSVISVCPFITLGTPPSNSDLVPTRSEYNEALNDLDIISVFEDIYDVIFNSQSCFPADEFNGDSSYGPLMIRLAWHCSGSFRETDGLGGCAGGRIRFSPEASWDDNTNLDKARAILTPIKLKYGDALSWGDLFVFAGTASIMSMGGPATKICAGRIDSRNGRLSLPLNEACDDQGNCGEPFGASTVGLIYVNPEGVEGNPVPSISADRIRDIFGRMGMNDTESVALIGGGHAFGKCHGACPLGPGPGPLDKPYNPWPGACGTGVGDDTFTSGIEGQWTSYPLRWDNEYFKRLVNDDYKLIIGPGGKYQWENKEEKDLIMLTTDLAFLYDDEYKAIVEMFANDISKLNAHFAASWEKLTTNGGTFATNMKCISAQEIVENAKGFNVSYYDEYYDYDYDNNKGKSKDKKKSNDNQNSKKKKGSSAFSGNNQVRFISDSSVHENDNNSDMLIRFIWISLIAAFVSLSVVVISYIFCLKPQTNLSVGLYHHNDDNVKAINA